MRSGSCPRRLETCDRARGHLYSFHQLTGSSDIQLGEAVEALRKAGHDEIADRIDRELVGRNVMQGHWTFQIVEDYDDNYWSLFRELEKSPATTWPAAYAICTRPDSSRVSGPKDRPATPPSPDRRPIADQGSRLRGVAGLSFGPLALLEAGLVQMAYAAGQLVARGPSPGRGTATSSRRRSPRRSGRSSDPRSRCGRPVRSIRSATRVSGRRSASTASPSWRSDDPVSWWKV